MVGIGGAPREQTRPRRELEHGLDVGDLHDDLAGKFSEQRIASGSLAQLYRHRTDLPPARVGTDATPESVREQLVAVADAE